MDQDTILVVDYGGQTCHLIARRIRQLKAYSKIVSPNKAYSPAEDRIKGIILSGGPHSVHGKEAPTETKNIFSAGVPVLGLCYGHQLIAHQLGGHVSRGTTREFGNAELHIRPGSRLFQGLSEKETVWMSHGDHINELPEGFKIIGSTKECATAAIENEKKMIFGLQFHPEVTHTRNGLKILENFITLCNCKQEWNMKSYAKQKQQEIRTQAKNKNVFMLVSGGVDSTVALALISTALGKNRVTGLHIDTGFMRKNESAEVQAAIARTGFAKLRVVDASGHFFAALSGIIDPEKKRKIIGNQFIAIQKKEMKKIGLDETTWLLGQGTIYPDTIESAATKHSSKIKTHHNRVQVIKKMIAQGKVIEPLKELYKDEVRELGKELGIDPHLLNRHPFPGPGLAIRALCSSGKQENFECVDTKVCALVQEGEFNARTIPLKSVGVQGDFRTYEHPCILQGPLDWRAIEKASTAITNKIRGINRVLFAVYPKKIESVEAISATLTRERITTLQEADTIVNEIVERENLIEKIWQFPVVLLPIKVNGLKETIVLRPVESMEAMTARFYRLPENILNEIAEKILAIKGIGAVLFDCTHKPPATIEWE